MLDPNFYSVPDKIDCVIAAFVIIFVVSIAGVVTLLLTCGM